MMRKILTDRSITFLYAVDNFLKNRKDAVEEQEEQVPY